MIITLCGSLRFEPLWHKWKELLSLDGHLIFDVVAYPSDKNGNKDWYTPAQKTIMDRVHLNKIQASDAVFIITDDNDDKYIGESTRNEINFAVQQEKQVYYSWGTCGHSTCYNRLHTCLQKKPINC